MIWIIVLVAVVLLVAFFIWLYNRLVRLRNRTDNAWSQVDVQLRRRYDLIPNLVETVKGYAAQAAQTVEEQGQAENLLTGALRRLFALAEAYPELRASENFQRLQAELSETENRIAVSRQIYNDSVLTYNNACQTVPSNIVASVAGFRTRAYLEIEDDARSAPEVQF